MVHYSEIYVAVTSFVLFGVNNPNGFLIPKSTTTTTTITVSRWQWLKPMLSGLHAGTQIDKLYPARTVQVKSSSCDITCQHNSTLVELQQSLQNVSKDNKTAVDIAIVRTFTSLTQITSSLVNNTANPCHIRCSLAELFLPNLNVTLQKALEFTKMAEPEVTIGLICSDHTGCPVAELLTIMKEFRNVFDLVSAVL